MQALFPESLFAPLVWALLGCQGALRGQFRGGAGRGRVQSQEAVRTRGSSLRAARGGPGSARRETRTLRRGAEPPGLGVGLGVRPRDREGTVPVTRDQEGPDGVRRGRAAEDAPGSDARSWDAGAGEGIALQAGCMGRGRGGRHRGRGVPRGGAHWVSNAPRPGVPETTAASYLAARG